MPRHAFVLGGTGQIGLAIASKFLASHWNVTISHRGSRPLPRDLVSQGAKVVILDRNNASDLSAALGSGTDVLIDTTAYNQEHASQLITLQGSIGSFIVISSASVYRDALGRTLDEAMRNGFPEFPDPILEVNPTVDPGPTTYSTRKIALENRLLDGAFIPVTVLRPCAIHGLYSRHPREWWFVKRILDRRAAIPLAYRGTSRFHTSAVANIAALAHVAAETPGHRILNIADPDPPTVADIAAFVARHLGYTGRIAKVDDPSYPPLVGRTPWSVPHSFVIDCSAALGLGYFPATTYAEAIGMTCDWLVKDAEHGNWQERYPVFTSYPQNPFDYAAEDAFLSMQR